MANEVENIEQVKESEWSFRKYFKAVFRFKWWVIGTTLVATALGFVVTKFLINPSKKVLSATYTYNLAAELEPNSVSTYRFIDGSLFDCYDIITKENLDAIKNADPGPFKNVDTEKLYDKNAITIEKYTEVINGKESTENTFKLSCTSNYFPSEKIGQLYLYRLICSPKDMSSKAISNFDVDSYVGADFAKDDFEKQVVNLQKQYDAIDSTYSELQDEFGKTAAIDSNGNKIYEAYNDFTSKYDNGTVNSISLLSSKLYSNFFVSYEAGKEDAKIAEIRSLCASYIKSIDLYKDEREVYNTALTNLTSSSTINTNDSTYDKKLVEVTEKIADLDTLISTIDERLNFYGYMLKDGKYVEINTVDPTRNYAIKCLTTKDSEWIKACAAFKSEVDATAKKLSADRSTATSAYKTIYSKYRNKVTFTNAGYVSVSEGVSSILGALIGFAAGYVISSLVVTAVYIYHKKEEKPAK